MKIGLWNAFKEDCWKVNLVVNYIWGDFTFNICHFIPSFSISDILGKRTIKIILPNSLILRWNSQKIARLSLFYFFPPFKNQNWAWFVCLHLTIDQSESTESIKLGFWLASETWTICVTRLLIGCCPNCKQTTSQFFRLWLWQKCLKSIVEKWQKRKRLWFPVKILQIILSL